ncbi:hypothetical protein B0H14DRAFT_3516650 [Mycena olivaceomarginata]|nr:hypothetical protein B0H14DRAFT_3516650 [Mycena olivaceomarginata]
MRAGTPAGDLLVLVGVDVWSFQLFHTTRTSRAFSEWQQISTHTFDIAAAVVHSLQLSTGRPDEDLSELDSGPPLGAISTVSSLSPLTWVPATASTSSPASSISTASTSSATPSVSTAPTGCQARDKAWSKRKCNAQRATTKLKTDILLDAAPPSSPKVRIVSTGWIGYRDNGVCKKEEKACMVEDGVAPTHRLPDFFRPQQPAARASSMVLVIEFPPGCTILIPSAAIYHSNIPIGRKEHRYSFTHAEQAEEEKELGLARAEAGAGLYSTIDKLRAAN